MAASLASLGAPTWRAGTQHARNGHRGIAAVSGLRCALPAAPSLRYARARRAAIAGASPTPPPPAPGDGAEPPAASASAPPAAPAAPVTSAAATTNGTDGNGAAAAAAPAAPAAVEAPALSPPTGFAASVPVQKLLSMFTVFSDKGCNSKLLALAVGQMLCSIATLIHDSYLPIYVQEELGLSSTNIGAVQGAAQFLCQLSKGVSGVVGDVLGSQTRVLVFGTLLTFACKPMFALLSSVYGVFGVTACLYWFFVAKLLDRLSKGIREAPTKAVMNELARESGDAPDAAYGLRQSLATAGMLIGSSIASLTFAATGSNYVITFAVASIPPAVALLWLASNFKDELFGTPHHPTPPAAAATLKPPPTAVNGTFKLPPPGAARQPPAVEPYRLGPAATPSMSLGGSSVDSSTSVDEPGGANGNGAGEPVIVLTAWEKAVAILRAFKPAYWQALAVVAVLYFARFDASFLSLRAKAVMPKSLLPMLTLVNTLIQMVLTAPLARVSGASVANRNRLLVVGFGFMIAADACLGLPALASPAGMFAGAAFVGLHMAMTHAITISMVSSYMPTGNIPGVGKLSGTAVSFTDLLLGFVLAASNTVAGVLADVTRSAGYGNVGCFAGGAAACVLAAVLLLAFERFGDLGKPELVVARKKKAKAA